MISMHLKFGLIRGVVFGEGGVGWRAYKRGLLYKPV
jgi:hypothetical protein